MELWGVTFPNMVRNSQYAISLADVSVFRLLR